MFFKLFLPLICMIVIANRRCTVVRRIEHTNIVGTILGQLQARSSIPQQVTGYYISGHISQTIISPKLLTSLLVAKVFLASAVAEDWYLLSKMRDV